MERLSPNGQIKQVRADHVARYEWAAARASGHVIDAGCNCGYGSALLADTGSEVTAVDVWPTGLVYAQENYDRPAIEWQRLDLVTEPDKLPLADAVVAFEVIEHLLDPTPFLKAARARSPLLFASVPNEDVWAWEPRLGPIHQRHYTKDEFARLLKKTGWGSIKWWGQVGGASPVEPDVIGRTIVAECR